MASPRWMLAVCFSLASVLGTGESVATTDTLKYTCKTFGSGVVQPFSGSGYYVRSNCPFTFTRFTHNRVECDITTQRGDNGLLVRVEIIINKIRTVLQNGSVLVEKMSVSLPYDHTYQHVFHYGIYTKLRSLLLPLSVTWHSVPGGIDTLWVELEQELSTDMTGLCGQHNVSGTQQQLIAKSVLTVDTCQTRDAVSTINSICRQFLSQTLDCLQAKTPLYIQLCEQNIYSYENSKDISCAFFKEVVRQCGNKSYVWSTWRSLTTCVSPTCPGDLVYVEQGAAFVPTCSNPNPSSTNQDLISSCVCPKGTVLNDRADVVHCVNVSNCPCVFGGKNYVTGDIHTTKCQSCLCDGGRWHCSENLCPARCLIEGQFVTTFDGKQYVVPGKCTYMASQGLNWTLTVQFSEREVTVKTVVLQLFQKTFTFSYNSVKVGEEEITELYQSENALVFWQSSMYVLVETSFGMKIQVQMSPEIQLYITPPRSHTGMISGLCGNNNNDTTDDFTTSSGITENSAQPFALSWSVGTCAVNIPPTCSNRDNEIFADEKCSVLNNPTGIFAECHGHIAADKYHTACIQRTCNCVSNLQQCLCVAVGSYAKACASLGVVIGDWRKATNCTLECQRNQQFSYNVRGCNHTCRSLSGPDPRCGLDDAPVEGCGCPEGTHLNQGDICTSKAECVCHHYGSTTPPGPVVIDGQQCLCENGELHCSKDCGCRKGKVCVHCSEDPVDTAQKTCDSLSKPMGASKTCDSGCYCPNDQLEDHYGNCVSLNNCTCMYGGKVFSPGQQVKTGCKTCVCHQAQWHCKDEPCPGKCQVYGNGHYQTFDSKWYRFDGHCQYTLVEDYCGNRNGSFSVRVESVPCCDEALTCSRSIILDLQGEVTLTLSDMRVTRRLQKDWTQTDNSLYTTHTVGLYIVISVPSKGITLIWDKHTRITIELHPKFRNQVCGLCGNFDSSEMNDLQISGSAGVSSPLAFGNSWKAATPPCSDVTTEIFPCERNSYCSAWAQRRCMIITGDTFKDCHLKVDPEPYYQACVQESCSCQFEGKFLGFCTAVAAYAEACSELDVCVKWRTPDLCPVYCDYYNEQDQCTWHYEACGEMLTCSKDNYFRHKLEGCYPRCPKDTPYYDENTGKCTKMSNCTCYFNDTIIQPGTVVMIQSKYCPCENGTITCPPPPAPKPSPRSLPTPSSTSTPAVPTTTTSVTSTMPTTKAASSTETRTTTPSTTSTTITNFSSTTETRSTMPSTVSTTTTTSTTTITSGTTAELYTTTTPTTSSPITSSTTTTKTSTSTASPATDTSVPPTTQTNTTELPTIKTGSTMPSTTSTPTTISSVSSTTEAWSTLLSTISTTMTTASSATTVISETPTALYNTTAVTTSSPTTSSTTTTAVSTEPTTVTNTTESTTQATAVTESSTSEATVTVPSTSYTLPTTSFTNATTMWRTETVTPTDTYTTEPTTQHTEQPPTTLQSSTTVSTSATPAQTSGSTVVTITEASTETITSSTTTQPTTTSTVSTTPHVSTALTPSNTKMSTSEIFTTIAFTSELTTTGEPTTNTTSTTTEKTYGTSKATASTQSIFTSISTDSTPHEVVTGSPLTPRSSPQVCNDCIDLKMKKSWHCGETWIEDCFNKTCSNGRIELTPVTCPKPKVPICPRGQITKVSDGCCETWKCDCRCELYGDPHYISFQGVTFDFLNDCTYILVEEQSPRHQLTIAVDNYYCVPGLQGSCAKGIILQYQGNTATLSINPDLYMVQATLNNVTIQPPNEQHGFRFETTEYVVSIYIPEVRSYVSLSPSYTLVVNLAMEHFVNNTRGQCGVCGGGSCIRRGGQIEADDCCEKTASDWVYSDPLKPACDSAPKNISCHPPVPPPIPVITPTPCPVNPLCELLYDPVFSECKSAVNLALIKKHCEFDSCTTPASACSSLEQAAKECRNAGICIDWRSLTNGSCDVPCPAGLEYRECHNKLDDFCFGGVRYPGASFERKRMGCFCPSGMFRAGNHSTTCINECSYCKGPHGEPRLPGEVWQSNCNVCTCNNQTRTEECFPKPPEPAPICGPGAVLVNTSCCGDQICVEKTCTYNDTTYKVGDKWKDAANPCILFSCSKEGVQTETKVCPRKNCPEEDRIWDNQNCCYTCNRTCAPKMSSLNLTIDNCTAVVQMPVCQGQCVSQYRVVLSGDLQVEQKSRCCQEQSSEKRLVTVHCADLTARLYSYKHVTSCECRSYSILR